MKELISGDAGLSWTKDLGYSIMLFHRSPDGTVELEGQDYGNAK